MKVYRLTKNISGEVSYKDGRNKRKSIKAIASEIEDQIIECNSGTMEFFASEEEARTTFEAIPAATASKTSSYADVFLGYYGAAILEESEEFDKEEDDERSLEELFYDNSCGEILAINKPEIKSGDDNGN